MPALAEGEAVRPRPVELWGAPAVHPPVSAPGFQAAERLGLLLLAFGVFAVTIPLGRALDAGVLSAVLAGAPFCAGVWLLCSANARDEVEFAVGYTSGRAYAGLWRIDRKGRVLRAADPSVPPPGWYPSPYYPGLLQRWDGPGWKPLSRRWWLHEHQYFRVPDRPFL